MKIKYYININQLAFHEALAVKVTLDDLALLDLVIGFERQEKSKKSDGYTWIDYRTASDQLPLARSLGSVSGVSRAMSRLVAAGLVETRRIDRAVYAQSTARCRELLGGRTAVPARAVQTPMPQPQLAERQHAFPRRWPQVAVLDALLVDLPPDQADAVVVLAVAAHTAGKARSLVDYAAGLARRARAGTLDTTTLPAISARLLAETRLQRSEPSAPGSAPESGREAVGIKSGIKSLRAALRGG